MGKKIIYGMFAQVILLLMLYAGLALMVAVKFLPDDPLATSLNYAHLAPWRDVTLQLALLTGILASGLYLTFSLSPATTLKQENLLQWAARGWTLLLIIAMLAGALNQLEGRHGLALPFILDAVILVLIAIFVAVIMLNRPQQPSAFIFVWMMGISLVCICIILGLIPAPNYQLDSILRSLSVNLTLNVGYVLCGLALAFWLMTRFSNVMASYAESGLYTVAGLLTIAGIMVSFAPLYPFGANSITGNLAVLIVPVCYAIFAAHSYRALSDHNPTQTLAAHWTTLFIILLFLSVGILGMISAIPGIQDYAQGTRLTDLQQSLTSFAIVAIILGMINQAVAEMRGVNARVTGLLPFWLIAFGILAGGAALALAGVVQLYLERILSVGYLETQTMLIPLYIFWMIGTFFFAVGIAIYAAGFNRRAVLETTAN